MALLLAGLVVVAACVAAALGRPIWAVSLGAALVPAYWALELLAVRRARGASDMGSVAVALGGMAARFVLVLGVLVIVGIVRRAAFADAALGFLAVYTVYMFIRLFANPARAAK